MMKAIAMGAAAAFCLGMAGTAAMAQGFGPGYTAPMMSGHPMYGQGPHWAPGMAFDRPMGMMVIDRNADGAIAADEAAAWHEANFGQMDEDGDGKVSKGEFLAGGMHQGRGAQHFSRRDARFAEIDADRDGTITLSEYIKDTGARFAAIDKDGDGKVSVWEYRGHDRM
ncbi:MAG: EF-hand domain-containing protein [Proteobacteria bacterium]|nr:EF-hand domain-containing protein [Pseudomonadota bacterium]